jgi:hypothetical protein
MMTIRLSFVKLMVVFPVSVVPLHNVARRCEFRQVRKLLNPRFAMPRAGGPRLQADNIAVV